MRSPQKNCEDDGDIVFIEEIEANDE